MSLKTYILAIGAAFTVLAANGAGVPMRNAAVGELAPFCAPANQPKKFTVQFMPDGQNYAEISEDGRRIVARDVLTGNETAELFDISHTRETTLPDFEGFRLSPDGSKLLVWRDAENIYRRSFTAQYYVYELRSRLLRPLSTEHPRQRDPLFSPDSRMLAFVADNNIYCHKWDYGTEVAVTTDGAANSIINGATDWTYEEEFSITSAMTWAPDNLTLCYLRFDETAVPMYSLPLYRGTCQPRDQYTYYPGTMSFKYPVAGEANSRVSLHSYDVETRKIKEVTLPGAPEYIPRIAYGSDASKLVVATLDRAQQHYEVFVVNPKSTVSKSIYNRTTNTWIMPEAYEEMVIDDSGVAIADDSGAYTRYVRLSYTGAPLGEVVAADADVTAYYGTDAAGNVYWQQASPTPIQRSVMREDRRGRRATIGSADGTANAEFAPGMNVLLLGYSDINTAPAYTFMRSDGTRSRVVEDNAAYAAAATPRKAVKEFVTINVNGLQLNGYLVKPRDFNASRKYPVIMSQYSGPGSQSVLNRWSLDWEDYYASQGYIVACFDGRGTGGRGTEFRTCVYGRLGELETLDQTAAARAVAAMPFVDSRKIGIYGWSYGGYESLMAASSDNCPYAAAVAIAPVTDWRFYDTVYAERYMNTPQANESGYRRSSAIGCAMNLGCPLLVMYGTADDNVHPQNSLQYVSTLQSMGIFADMFVFPNMNHSINGCNARSVVYGRMLEFFNDKMNLNR